MIAQHKEAMMSPTAGRENKLLAFLSDADRQRLENNSARVTVPLHEVVCDPGEPVHEVHFPLSCVFSHIIQMRDGSAVEAATVGNEGLVGLATLYDDRASIYRVVQQVEGPCLRMEATAFRRVVSESASLQNALERFAATVTYQCGRNAGCNLRHTVQQRLCRWLLMTHDRVEGDEYFLTQEDLSSMLGVRRQSVSEVAKPLQDEGGITYTRGRMKIQNRALLEQRSCECYDAIWEMYHKIMGTERR